MCAPPRQTSYASVDSGPNAFQGCTAAGTTDTACPPLIVGNPPVIPNPLVLNTEPKTLPVPANNPGGGATNPAATYCGACDLDDTIGRQNDQDCVDQGVCGSGFGLACCAFGTNTGALSTMPTGRTRPWAIARRRSFERT